MKKILITGENSYIGNSLKNWIIKNHFNKVNVQTISLRNEEWINKDFSDFDAIVHVAGIAHVPVKKKTKNKYHEINVNLTNEVAKKAVKDNVKHFIFISSMIIFGNGSKEINYISEHTLPNPVDEYGESKLLAEEKLLLLSNQYEEFKLTIVRPPMVYGVNSKGNFPRILKFANNCCLFPLYNNSRSVIYVDNLSECISQIILRTYEGIIHPQNKDQIKTSDIVKWINLMNGKTPILFTFLNVIIKLGIDRNKTVQKVFGNFAYSNDLSNLPFNYQIVDTRESIKIIQESIK